MMCTLWYLTRACPSLVLTGGGASLSNNVPRRPVSLPPFLSPGIPLLCFLVLLPLNIPWSQISVTWLGVVHFLACLSPQLGSVLYHLFMNHEGGEPVYHTLLKLDVCGICMINTLGKPSPAGLSTFPHPSSFCIYRPLCCCRSAARPDCFIYLLIVNDLPWRGFAWRCASIDPLEHICLLSQLANASNDPRSKMGPTLAYFNKKGHHFAFVLLMLTYFPHVTVIIIVLHVTLWHETSLYNGILQLSFSFFQQRRASPA